VSERMRVKIRRGPGWRVKPEAEQIDGKTYTFFEAWLSNKHDPYPGERVWMPCDDKYPGSAPAWIAEGDLERVDDNEEVA